MAVVKILTRHSPSYKSLIKYILNEDKTDKKTIFTHNLRAKDIDGYTKEFMENESFRQRYRSDQVYLSHEIISFHKDENSENITTEMLKDMVKQYIQLRGNEGMYLGAVHHDTEHIHIHLAVSALAYRTGKSFHVAKPELHQLKTEFQKFHKEKYPEISKSFPEHGKGQKYLTDRAWQKAHRVERDQLSIEVSNKIQECLDKSQNRTEFLNQLRDANIHHYERSGRIEGIMTVGGTKFRFSRLGFAEKISALSVKEETNEPKLSNEQTPKIMNTKDKNEEQQMSEFALSYLDWQLKTNADIYDAVTNRKNEMFLEVQNTATNSFTPEQNNEIEELERKEQSLISEREELEMQQIIQSHESEEKEMEELAQIREVENERESEMETVQEPESDYDSLDAFDEIEPDEPEDLEETELDELDDIRDSNEDYRDMDDDMDLGDEP